MHKYLFSLIILVSLVSCKEKSAQIETESLQKGTFTKSQLAELSWLNRPDTFRISDSILSVSVVKETDYFNNPEDSTIVATAPLLYKDVSGDFMAKALVQPDFSSQWNAVSLMVHIDDENWIKFAFENSDATGPSVVTVVTKGRSDDANGAVLNDQDQLWLAIARKGNNYAMHWSTDNEKYNMARLTSLPPRDEVKIGIEMQSPVGDNATHRILSFEILPMTVNNMRDLSE